MVKRVSVATDMLVWARERAGYQQEDLVGRFSKLPEWERGTVQPTLKQLEKFSKAVHVSFGYLFMREPPDEPLPIRDFRTFDNEAVSRPSLELLDTIYACQERQTWYSEFAQQMREPRLSFVGSANISMKHEFGANSIRNTIYFDIDAHQNSPTKEKALSSLICRAERAGILVMISSIVQSNTRRTLKSQEFLGFALSEPFAPLVFINGSSSKSAQLFTLAHEIAHLWLNSSGVSKITAKPYRGNIKEEIWCNGVAAELLVPLEKFQKSLKKEKLSQAVPRLSKSFKVSSLVILRRLLDARWLGREDFEQEWAKEEENLRKNDRRSAGGNFYSSTISRVSKRLTRAIVASTLEGTTLYRDAFRMLGINKTESFNKLSKKVMTI